MPRYLISFDDGSMDHISEADLPAVGEAAHAVVREANAAGVWIFGAGVPRQQSSIVETDGTISDGPAPETKAVIGGFSIIEVSSRKEALVWQPGSPRRVDVPKRFARLVLIRSPDDAQRRSDCET